MLQQTAVLMPTKIIGVYRFEKALSSLHQLVYSLNYSTWLRKDTSFGEE